ncbi:MAG: hypothetical protein HC912_04875 [Saprospiraceae bacterium]|nr:hypothetical protein [Saprospiraceae bacterium]
MSKLIKKPATTTTSSSSNTASDKPASGTETSVSKQYKQRITGKRLLYLYTENGSSEKKYYDLCTNGTFYYYSNFSYLSGDFQGLRKVMMQETGKCWLVAIKIFCV